MQTIDYDFIKLAEVDSTSDEARRRLSQKNWDRPLAIQAKRQSKGRGRLGKSWQSPPGNLYLTLVIPTTLLSQNLEALSLRVGILIAEWIEQVFGLRLTLKWPNDLLFGAQKVGGILVEVISDGATPQFVSIGIGINLHATPQGVDQRSAAISQFTSESFSKYDVFELGQGLINDLIQGLLDGEVLNRFHRFAMDRGQPILAEKHWFQFEGIAQDGSLKLGPWSALGRPLQLSSAHDETRWLYQVDPHTPILVADGGNTTLKLGLYRQASQGTGPNQIWISAYEPEEITKHLLAIKRELSTQHTPTPFPIYLACVNQKGEKVFTQLAKNEGFAPISIQKRALRLNFEAYSFSEIGIDRVALSEAASWLYPSHHLILVSCGTANTVEIISKDRIYRGGWILPGIMLKLSALAEGTDLLPEIGEESVFKILSLRDRLGHHTKQALINGAYWETIGAIRELHRHMEKVTGEGWHILVTGGWGKVVASGLDADYRAHLSLDGIRALALGGWSLS